MKWGVVAGPDQRQYTLLDNIYIANNLFSREAIEHLPPDSLPRDSGHEIAEQMMVPACRPSTVADIVMAIEGEVRTLVDCTWE